MAAAAPKGGELARRRLFEDLERFAKGLPSGASPELNLEIVVGIMLQLMRALGEGRLSSLDHGAAVGSILRAIGLSAHQAKSVLARLPADGAMPDGPRPPKSRRPGTESCEA